MKLMEIMIEEGIYVTMNNIKNENIFCMMTDHRIRLVCRKLKMCHEMGFFKFGK